MQLNWISLKWLWNSTWEAVKLLLCSVFWNTVGGTFHNHSLLCWTMTALSHQSLRILFDCFLCCPFNYFPQNISLKTESSTTFASTKAEFIKTAGSFARSFSSFTDTISVALFFLFEIIIMALLSHFLCSRFCHDDWCPQSLLTALAAQEQMRLFITPECLVIPAKSLAFGGHTVEEDRRVQAQHYGIHAASWCKCGWSFNVALHIAEWSKCHTHWGIQFIN